MKQTIIAIVAVVAIVGAIGAVTRAQQAARARAGADREGRGRQLAVAPRGTRWHRGIRR